MNIYFIGKSRKNTEFARSTKRRLSFGLLAAFLIALNGSAMAQEQVKLRVGYNVVPLDAPLHLAREDQLFEKSGIDVAWKRFESGNAVIQALALGEIDLAAATEIPGIRPKLMGGKYVVVGQSATAVRMAGIYASSAIKSPLDLVGKKVGVTLGTASELYLGLYAEKYGVPYEKIQKVNVAPPEWIPALHRGDIDAFAGWEHFFSRADEILPKGTGHLIQPQGADAVYTAPMYYYMRQSIADGVSSGKIIRVLIDAERAVNSDRERAAAISAKTANVDNATSLKIINLVQYKLKLDDASVSALVRAAKFLKDKKLVDSIPDWKTFINPLPLQSVDASRVQLGDRK